MSAEPLCFRLELERGSQPITGRLSTDDGQTIPFRGWLELMSALEQARIDPAESQAKEGDRRADQ